MRKASRSSSPCLRTQAFTHVQTNENKRAKPLPHTYVVRNAIEHNRKTAAVSTMQIDRSMFPRRGQERAASFGRAFLWRQPSLRAGHNTEFLFARGPILRRRSASAATCSAAGIGRLPFYFSAATEMCRHQTCISGAARCVARPASDDRVSNRRPRNAARLECTAAKNMQSARPLHRRVNTNLR